MGACIPPVVAPAMPGVEPGAGRICGKRERGLTSASLNDADIVVKLIAQYNFNP